MSETRPPSFASHLINAFDDACAIGDENLRFMKEVAVVLRKRQELEAAYAKSLKKLAAQHEVFVPEAKRGGAVSGDSGPSEKRSLLNLWHAYLESMNEIGAAHDDLALRLGLEVCDKLASLQKSVEAKRKQAIGAGRDQLKKLKDEHNALTKANAAFAQARSEVDDGETALNLANSNFQTKNSTLNKLLAKKKAADEKCQLSLRSLITTKQRCREAQVEHYESKFPATLEELEKCENSRSEGILSRISVANLLQIETIQASQRFENTVSTAIQNTDKRCDVEEQILAVYEKKSGEAIAVSGILQFSLKDYIRATSQHSSSKTFKDYLFVLSPKDRLLYQFENDSAQQPKAVYTLPLGYRVVRPVHPSLFGRRNVFQLCLGFDTLFLECHDKQLYDEWTSALREVCESVSRQHVAQSDKMALSRSIDIHVVEAKELSKSGNYKAMVVLDKQMYSVASCDSSTNAPYFNQQVTMDDIPLASEQLHVELIRNSGNFGAVARQSALNITKKMVTLGRDNPRKSMDASLRSNEKVFDGSTCAKVSFNLNELSRLGRANESWHTLVDPETGSNNGKIRLKVTVTDEIIRPARDYLFLSDTFSPSNPDLQVVLKLVNECIEPSIRVPFASVLMSVAASNKGLLGILKALCSAEVNSASDASTLFRGNSLTTKTLDEFMKLVTIETSDYLRFTLGMPIQVIYDSKASCELDPTRIVSSETEDAIAKNMKKLLQNLYLFWNSITHSLHLVPDSLRVVLHYLKTSVAAKFGSESVAQSSVAAFFFLRLICPAILGPQLFGLQHAHPEATTARTLTLISKIIQNLAFGIEFGQKEPYMIELNAFIAENKKQMQECLSRISSLPDADGGDPSGGNQALHAIELMPAPRCLAAMHRILESALPSLEAGSASEKFSQKERAILSDLVANIKAVERPSSEERKKLFFGLLEEQVQLERTDNRHSGTLSPTDPADKGKRKSALGGLLPLPRRSGGGRRAESADMATSMPHGADRHHQAKSTSVTPTTLAPRHGLPSSASTPSLLSDMSVPRASKAPADPVAVDASNKDAKPAQEGGDGRGDEDVIVARGGAVRMRRHSLAPSMPPQPSTPMAPKASQTSANSRLGRASPRLRPKSPKSSGRIPPQEVEERSANPENSSTNRDSLFQGNEIPAFLRERPPSISVVEDASFLVDLPLPPPPPPEPPAEDVAMRDPAHGTAHAEADYDYEDDNEDSQI